MKNIKKILQNRILVLDGAMGTMIQREKLTEKDFRSDRFAHVKKNQQGNNDLLCLTQAKIIQKIHEQYLQAGADIIETNTFNANDISLADYEMQNFVTEINFKAAQIAKIAADKYSNLTPNKPRFVAGSMGPTNKTASISPNVNDPGFRDISFNELVDAYGEQASALVQGGVDILLVETVFDTLNAKAALFAIENLMKAQQRKIPVMLSVTLSDSGGRTLSGQTLEAFVTSFEHIELLSIGLNCSFGAKEMKPHLEKLAQNTSLNISAYPNAGMPNELGEYTQTPKIMFEEMKQFTKNQSVNIIGGCCGTTPEHVKKFVLIAEKSKIREFPDQKYSTKLSGLENLKISKENNFINIGERTNVAGSLKFKKLILNKKYDEAINFALHQVENGAQIIDICMDDSMLEGTVAMKKFLNLIAAEPDIAKVPVMIDSSNWETIESGLKITQGKSIVNSISLKEGEKKFVEKACKIRQYGAAVVVILFDENGQATSFPNKISIAKRAYDLLVKKAKFSPQDIIFDSNVLPIGTGIEEHNNYAVNFIKAVKWIKENLPHAKTSGGISNLSFSFRGHNQIREAMHSVFLYHAIKAGLDMGIVNPAMLTIYENIPKDLLILVENLILNRKTPNSSPTPTEKLLQYAEKHKNKAQTSETKIAKWRNLKVEQRIQHALIKGTDKFLITDLEELQKISKTSLEIIEKTLMEGMNKIGKLFGEGKMFLPQVIKSARVMKNAVTYLTPFIEKESATKTIVRKKILLATVKGDVHDIGKNIASVILSCNNIEVIDLGVMVEAKKIVKIAKERKIDIIGLSGLITPSLTEMIYVAKLLNQNNLKIPILIGGATTSKLHTAVKIATEYDAPVFQVKDASISISIINSLLDKNISKYFIEQNYIEQEKIRTQYFSRNKTEKITIEEARKNKFKLNWKEQNIIKPEFLGTKIYKNYSLQEISQYIDWDYLFRNWGLKGKYPEIFNNKQYGNEAKELFSSAKNTLNIISQNNNLIANAIIGIFPANATENDSIEIYSAKSCQTPLEVSDNSSNKLIHTLKTPRQQNKKTNDLPNYALSDFLAPKNTGITDYIGSFACTIKQNQDSVSTWLSTTENKIMFQVLSNILVEAFSELLHEKLRKELWKYTNITPPKFSKNGMEFPESENIGIRPAIGYPSLPDHAEKEALFELLNVTETIGISLTENYAMLPASSVCGYYFANSEVKYFGIQK